MRREARRHSRCIEANSNVRCPFGIGPLRGWACGVGRMLDGRADLGRIGPQCIALMGDRVCTQHQDQTRHMSHVPAFLRHAPAGERVGHQDGAGVARAQRREDDDGLYARAEPRPDGCQEPVGPA